MTRRTALVVRRATAAPSLGSPARAELVRHHDPTAGAIDPDQPADRDDELRVGVPEVHVEDDDRLAPVGRKGSPDRVALVAPERPSLLRVQRMLEAPGLRAPHE